MPFNARHIYPIDQTPDKGVGVSIPFSANGVFTTTYTTKDSIRNNLINFILTGQQERLFTPNYGADLKNYVFQQITQDSVADLQNQIESSIEKYFPNVKGTMNIQTDTDSNTVFVTYTYSIINTGISDIIQINVSNG